MSATHVVNGALREVGLERARVVHWNQPAPVLYEETVRRALGRIAREGPLVVNTAPYTGRSPKDKFIVREPDDDHGIAWGPVNQPLDPERFDALFERVRAYLEGRDLFVQDLRAGADPEHRVPLRGHRAHGTHAFAQNLLLRIDDRRLRSSTRHDPQRPVRQADRPDGTRSAFIALSLSRNSSDRGTSYAGEIKVDSSR
jgi:phosphoenolpyruvate carboxykinase (ATP)